MTEAGDKIDPEIKEPNHLAEISAEIEQFVEWILVHHCDLPIRGTGKVIHDGVWGTNRYSASEVAVINSPLVQRLRQIHQTAYTYLTYPSTSHTRFDHTLGVTTQVGKLISSLENKFIDLPEKKDLVDTELARTIRFAALLHDTGHGPASHTSEEIYKHYEEITTIKKELPFIFPSAHEIFSYLILGSDPFKKFIEKASKHNPFNINFELAQNAIIGFSPDPNSQYKIDILNGPFDADKLDYLFRDGHFSGLPLGIDLDRLWYALDINIAKDRRRLTVDWGGVSSLEQIVFSKMMLFPAVYHHHKVRACDCMFKGIIEYIKKKEISLKDLIPNTPNEHAFSRATHFLYFTDDDILGLLDKLPGDPVLHDLVHNLRYRRLLKRAVVISPDTLENASKIDAFNKYIEDNPQFYRDLAEEIRNEGAPDSRLEEVWVDCPKDPTFISADDTWISPLGDGHADVCLSDFFKIQNYANQYKYHKSRAHVFCCPEDIENIAAATKKVFKTKLDINFKPLAFDLCHIPPPPD